MTVLNFLTPPPPRCFVLVSDQPFAKNPHVYYGTLEEGAGEGAGPPDTTFKSCTGKEHTRDEYGNIEDELVKGISNEEGTLSMANSGEPDTGGSQFFINVKDNKHLDWFNGESESFHPVVMIS